MSEAAVVVNARVIDARMIPLDLLDEPFLPQRSKFNDAEFAALVESISHNGVEVPLKVRPVGERFQIIAGHRRYTAAKVAGLELVPCVVESCTDLEALRKMIAENSGREEPSDSEQGRHYLEICERFSLDEASVAKMVGKTEAYVSDRCDLVRRFPELAEANESGAIRWGVAEQLKRVNEYTYAKELRLDPRALGEDVAEKIRRHRLMLLDLCVQQGATTVLAKSYVEQWKRSIIPLQPYDPNASAPASAPQAAPALNHCAACGETNDQLAMVVLYVHSWEKAALRNVLRAAGMFGYE